MNHRTLDNEPLPHKHLKSTRKYWVKICYVCRAHNRFKSIKTIYSNWISGWYRLLIKATNPHTVSRALKSTQSSSKATRSNRFLFLSPLMVLLVALLPYNQSALTAIVLEFELLRAARLGNSLDLSVSPRLFNQLRRTFFCHWPLTQLQSINSIHSINWTFIQTVVT